MTPECPLKALPALNPLPAYGRWEPGFPLQHHLVFSSFLAASSPLPPSPVQTPLSNGLFFSERKRGDFGVVCPSPFLQGQPWHLWAGGEQMSALLQLQERGRSQAAKQEEKIILD